MPVGAPGGLDVAVMQVAVRAGADVDDLVGRLLDSVALGADVHEEGFPEARRHLAESHELGGVGVGGRDVDES